jgi:hypothetical protein
MPKIITLSEMKNYVSEHITASRQLFESSSLSLENYQYQPYTFVSYSSKDSEYLPYVLKILTNHGAKPYVDKGDDRLPNPPSVKTAEVLKDTIKKSKRMVVFVTTNSKDSKWVPWELGLGDGSKSNNEIALFPSAENSYETKWLEQEYLGLYRRIVYGKHADYPKEIWMVYDYQSNTAIALEEWLQ